MPMNVWRQFPTSVNMEATTVKTVLCYVMGVEDAFSIEFENIIAFGVTKQFPFGLFSVFERVPYQCQDSLNAGLNLGFAPYLVRTILTKLT